MEFEISIPLARSLIEAEPHVYASGTCAIFGSDNGLASITGNNACLLLVVRCDKDTVIFIKENEFEYATCKFCLGLNVLIICIV